VLPNHPLVVDLDGTLIHTDMLHESSMWLLRDKPFRTLGIPFLLTKGKAVLKAKLAGSTDFSVESLPYNIELIEWLKSQRVSGRRLILCTASDQIIANKIADHLQIFDEVIASDGHMNLAGVHKADELVKRFGESGFDYAGNSSRDLPVWEKANRGVVVNGKRNLAGRAAEICNLEKEFPPKPIRASTWARVLRVHQWLKNLLLFVPLLAAHQLENIDGWIALVLSFFAFGLCASSVYITNDLLDLESDRAHPRKRSRPFASGLVPIWMGVIIAPLLLVVSFLLAWVVGWPFFSWLLFYFLVTVAYSFYLKRLVLIDCLVLALLYTLRIVAGAAAIGLGLTFWLLAFSVFLFLSLAFIKRYAELEIKILDGNQKLHGRGYHTADAVLVQTMGIVSGYVSVLVLALYLNSAAVVELYTRPEIVMGAVPVMLFWVSWMWLQAHRGQMHDDPLVFAVKDGASLLAGFVFAIVLVLGSMGLPW
jgi:4-hydroxybenzoate polyprenyltransferase/phosphoserine phosphatase